MKISIAMCTFNGSKYLREQLESIAKQSKLPDELIICDDKSSDDSPAIIEDFSKSSPFNVKFYVNESKLGIIKNFEKAISLCEGEIIFLSDHDDVWLPEKIELIEKEFANDNVSLVFSDAEIVTEKLEPLISKLSDVTFTERAKKRLNPDILEFLFERNIVTGMTMAFRTEIRRLALPIPTDIPETIHDGWFALTASLCGDCIFVGKNLVKYRQHKNQMIGASAKDDAPPIKENASRVERMKEYSDKAFYNVERLNKIRENLERQVFPEIEPKKVEKAIKLLEKEKQQWTNRAEHFRARMLLPKNRVKRISTISEELRKKRYFTFSSGLRSAIKDLFAK